MNRQLLLAIAATSALVWAGCGPQEIGDQQQHTGPTGGSTGSGSAVAPCAATTGGVMPWLASHDVHLTPFAEATVNMCDGSLSTTVGELSWLSWDLTQYGYGKGWRADFDVRGVVDGSGNFTILYADRNDIYSLSNGTFTPPPQDYTSSLTKSGANYVLTKHDKSTLTFAQLNGCWLSSPSTCWGVVSTQDVVGNIVTYNRSPVHGGVTSVFQNQFNNTPITVNWTTTAPYSVLSYATNVDQSPSSCGPGSSCAVTLTQDANGDTITIQRPTLSTTANTTSLFTIGYDTSFRVTTIKDPVSETGTITYSGSLVSTVSDNKGYQTAFFWTGGQAPPSSAWVGSDKTQFNYVWAINGSFTTIKQIIDALTSLTTTTFYDTNANLTQYVDQDGVATTYTYNTTRDTVSMTDGHGNQTTYSWDGSHNMLSRTDRALSTNNVEQWAYNANNQITQYINAVGDIIKYAYDTTGRLTSITLPDNKTITYAYTNSAPLNLVASMTSPQGEVTSYSYDSNGNLISLTNAHGSRSYTTTPAGAIVTATNNMTANNVTTSFKTESAYSPAPNAPQSGSGLVLSMTRPNGNVVQYTYDAVGRVLSESERNWNVSYTYTNANSVSTQTNNGISYQSGGPTYSMFGTPTEAALSCQPSSQACGTGCCEAVSCSATCP